MVAQETSLLNAFETTLSTTLGASGTTVTLTAVTDSASNNITAPCYLVIEPDSATNREYVLVSAINIGTKTITLGDGGSSYRYLTGSSATSGLSHASGATIRYVPMAQHIEDINDRVDTIMNSAGTAVNTSGLVKDEDNMSSDSATHLATQQSIKKYVDDKVTAEDLDVETDSGNIDIDLDSEALTIAGGEGIDTSATGTTVTIAGEEATTSNKGVASFSSDNFAVSSGAVTIKTGGVDNDELAGSITNAKLSNSTVSYGGVSLALGASDATPAFDLTDATNYPTSSLSGTITNAQLAGSIANAKLSNSSITVSDGSSSTAISLGGTITFSGTSNEVEIAESSGTLTIGLPATITANVTGNVSGTSGSTTGNAATATALATARNIGGVSFDGTGNIDLPGVNSAGNQNTSGTAADLSATLDETKGGTGLTSFTTGDVVYASGSNTLAKLGIGSSGEVLSVSSGGIVEWAASSAGDITGVTIETASNSGLGGGDTASSGAFSATLTTDLNNLTAATVDVAADSIAIVDADASNGTRKESIADLVDAIDGTALSASSGVLNVSGITTSEIASGTLVDSSDTIAGNDNDTTIPTSKAVKGYVDAQGFADIGLIIALG